MKTQYYAAASLDGFIADEQHSLEWLFQFGSIDDTSYPDFIRDVGAIAMGSTTYEWILRHPSEVDPEGPTGWPYEQPAWVFSSRSHASPSGRRVHFVEGDVAPVHRRMVEAAAGKNIWVMGGGDLAGQFLDADLLDEIIVQVAPVTLGGGAPLLPRRATDPPLRLVAVEQYGHGLAELRYQVSRPDPTTGTNVEDAPSAPTSP